MKSLTNEQTQPVTRPPVMLMVAAGIALSLVVALLGGLIGQTNGAQLSDALWTIAPMCFGIFLTALMLNVIPARAPGLWAAPVMMGTIVRAGVVLGVGFAVFTALGTDKNVFFLTLVSSLVIVLTADVFLTVRMIQKHAPAHTGRGVVEGS